MAKKASNTKNNKIEEKEKTTKKTNKNNTTKNNTTKKEATKKQTSKTVATKKETEKKVVTKKEGPKKEIVETKEVTKKGTTKNVKKSSDAKKIIVLVAIILVVFAIFYVITVVLDKNNHDDIFKQDDLGNAEIQYDKIIVGTMLKQKPDTYYVLATKDDDNAESYQSLLSEYEGYDYEYKIYTIDLDDALNKGSLADESSFEDDIKFKGNTLLKIEDKKVTDVYESEDSITDKLNELIDSLKNED